MRLGKNISHSIVGISVYIQNPIVSGISYDLWYFVVNQETPVDMRHIVGEISFINYEFWRAHKPI